MGSETGISWCDHTFNPWIGCSKVSPGCANCYAERDFGEGGRYNRVKWGPNGTRSRTSDANWKQPLAWDKAAKAAGVRRRVFCASLADVFEELPHDHPQQPDLAYWRADLWTLIESTPHLDWLLLTKRPENVRGRVPTHWHSRLRPEGVSPEAFKAAAKDWWPSHVWIGTSVENQATADERIPHLLRIPARLRFLSCEPLLGAVKLPPEAVYRFRSHCSGLRYTKREAAGDCTELPSVHWVIAGGESGLKARPMHPDWVRSLRDQCQAARVAFHFKQHGMWKPVPESEMDPKAIYDWVDDAGQIGQCWKNSDGTWKQAPLGNNPAILAHVGKAKAGRLLDGREWNEFPEVAA